MRINATSLWHNPPLAGPQVINEEDKDNIQVYEGEPYRLLRPVPWRRASEGDLARYSFLRRNMTKGLKKVSPHKDREPTLSPDLGSKVHEVDSEWTSDLYSSIARDEELIDFLKSDRSGYYVASGRWTVLPANPGKKDELATGLLKILSAVIRHFHPSTPTASVSREVVDTHDIPLAHCDSRRRTSQPDISIKAKGPSFEVPCPTAQGRSNLGYGNIAAVIDVRLDKEWGNIVDQANRVALSCRQIMAQQPNRNFARSLTVTEKHFRLFHYDRSGTYTTPIFDTHKHPQLFIRYVLGIASSNEEVLGLDTSLQWQIDEKTGRKVSGTISLEEYDDQTRIPRTVTYDLDMTQPPYVRSSICGRGTVGWHAIDPATKTPVFIKDAWHRDTRDSSEANFLKAAKGFPGVVEMLAYQDFCAQTSEYHPQIQEEGTSNRIKLRIVTKKYGPPIWYFRSRLQLLQAFRDALAGHRVLLDREILHRDVSLPNILLGSDTEGSRGVLIDLDLAVRTDGLYFSSIPPNPGVGTRLYQSISVLNSLESTPRPKQEYLDDLESFFYVLSHIMFAFTRPGVLAPTQPPGFMEGWPSPNPYISAATKYAFVCQLLPVAGLSEYWHGACLTLLEEFQGTVKGILRAKEDISGDRVMGEDEKVKAYEGYSKANSDPIYEKAKAVFDKAIAQLESEGPCPEEIEPYPAELFESHMAASQKGSSSGSDCNPFPSLYVFESSSSQGSGESGSRKRRLSEEDEEEGDAGALERGGALGKVLLT
ncbi:hypothetical protein NMY22_g1036 [Coprinellus aureogranulatus]|nr:hypothetical protein NMY22_g1036 [Coprinellus aureogranulatus]